MNRMHTHRRIVRIALGGIFLLLGIGVIVPFFSTRAIPLIPIVSERCTGDISTKDLVVLSAGQKVGLNNEQSMLLQVAKEIGESVGHPETAQTLAMVETQAGKLGKVGDGGDSLGELQTQLPAARAVLKEHPELGKFTDRQLRQKLLSDSKFAITIGVLYFDMIYKGYASIKNPQKRWEKSMLCYNAGPRNAAIKRDPQKYIKWSKFYMAQVVRPFNAHVKSRLV
jgi:hypothetical protein